MPDISKCFGTDCKLKVCCYRYTVSSDGDDQSFMNPPPFKENDGLISCERFWFNDLEMIESDELKAVIYAKIEKQEGSGDMAGGSGHLSHKTHEITLVKTLAINENSLLLYAYDLCIQSEFSTKEYTYVELVLINREKQVLNSERLITRSNDNEDDADIDSWTS